MTPLESIRNKIIDACHEALDQPGLAPETWAALKSLEKLVEQMQKLIVGVTADEVCKYGKEGISKHGFLMTEAYVGGKYDYTLSAEWRDLDKRKSELEKNMQFAYRAGNKGLIDSDSVYTPPAVPTGGSRTVKCMKVKEEQL